MSGILLDHLMVDRCGRWLQRSQCADQTRIIQNKPYDRFNDPSPPSIVHMNSNDMIHNQITWAGRVLTLYRVS